MNAPHAVKSPPFSRRVRVVFFAAAFAIAIAHFNAAAQESALAAAGTNWLVAQMVFQAAGGLIGDQNFDEANKTLLAAQTNLRAPYSGMATQFVQQLRSMTGETNPAKRVEAASGLCAALQAHGAALKLKPPKNLNIPADDEDDAVAWSLFENGNLGAALVRYERKLATERIQVYQQYYLKQVRMIHAWSNNAANPAFALELARERYMKGYERKPDVFGALRALQRALPNVAHDTNGVQMFQQFIICLSALRDEAGRDAWENQLLADFKSDADACAGVYYDRGIRAYHERRDYDTSLNWMRKLCGEFPGAKLWGDAQYSVGLILQDQKKYDEAIAAFGVIFPSKLNDYALEPGSSEDCKNYRYKASLRTSECYESKSDLPRALEFAQKAAIKYPYVSYCSFCQKQGRDAAMKRVMDLEKRMPAAQ